MLRLDRICVWGYMIMFIMIIPSIALVKFFDEAVIYSLYALTMADCVINRRWRHYRLLLIFTGVMVFYIVYSITCVHYNPPSSVLYGAVLESKPYLSLLIFLTVAPTLQPGDRRMLRGIAIFNGSILALSLTFWYYAKAIIFTHPAFYGGVAFITALIYLLCSLDSDGAFTRRGLTFFCVILAVGFFSTRSKYYAEAILALFFIYFYRQGMTRKITLSQLILIIFFGGVTILAVWQKFSFYFLQGIDLSHIDLNKMASYARMALYAMMFVVLYMYPLFGSGLASYASYASAEPSYSALYAELGLNHVYGLSEDFHDFISDAYYPSLAQFGIIGIILFIAFWVMAYRRLRIFTRTLTPRARSLYIIGAALMISTFIEMTTGSLSFQPPGELMVMTLGIICGMGDRLMKSRTAGTAQPLPAVPAIHRIR